MGISLFIWINRPEHQLAEQAQNRDFLTEQTLREVEKNEAAYRQSIEKLSELAAPDLKNASSPRAVNYREKLMLLDAAISDLRQNVDRNRFNTSLQMQLAGLYRENSRRWRN